MCGKIGHTIDICYNRFNKKFVPNSGKNSNKGTTNNFRNNNDKLSTAFVTSHPANPFNVTRENSVDANWYANNRAMNHMTADYTNLANPVEYGGKVQVTIGNGDKLKITSIGNSTLMNGGYMLSLDNVLYVPAIAKHLVSVSKRARDKHVFVEFHDDYCLVKDNGTRQTILKGMLKDDLYHLEEAVVKLAAKGKRNTNDSKKVVDINKVNQIALILANIFVNSFVSKNTWHRCLGHPSSRNFDLITRRCNLTLKNESYNFANPVKWVKVIIFHSLCLNLVP